MKKHILLGDLHGEFTHLKHILKNHQDDWASVTILGDLGIGFPGLFNPPFKPRIPVHFIRGNHDNPDHLADLPEQWAEWNWHYIQDGTIKDGTLYIGGAWSIDAPYRTPGRDWWFNEELSERQWQQIIQKIRAHEGPIHTVITHDAPMSLYPALGIFDPKPNRTMHYLEHLYRHELKGDKRPTRWYFGHHHQPLEVDRAGIIFRCIDSAITRDRVELPAEETA